MAQLRKSELTKRRANDILRAAGLEPAPLDDPRVIKDLIRTIEGKELSPVLVVSSAGRADIADVSTAFRWSTDWTRTDRCRSGSPAPWLSRLATPVTVGESSWCSARWCSRPAASAEEIVRPLSEQRADPRAVLDADVLLGTADQHHRLGRVLAPSEVSRASQQVGHRDHRRVHVATRGIAPARASRQQRPHPRARSPHRSARFAMHARTSP